jgi:hypothetical protein
MVNEESLRAVAASSFGEGRLRPLYGSYCFSGIPGTVERLLGGVAAAPLPDDCLAGLDPRPERVVLILIDAFGWRQVERFADHPLLGRVREEGVLSKLTSQFPSTTAAHITTLASGLPVGAHGVYEWFLYEPTIDRLVAPLLYTYAGESDP